ncbi:phospholipase D regulator [Rhodotorula paludigena]|uniref:phospholipase D regulator n=1 Tax=Rhodotorula paludigena TaxID=86838 RepID=UPI0031793B49
MASGDSHTRYQYQTGARKVVTVPAWARNLPPDDLSSDEDDGSHVGPIPPRPSTATRRLSSIVRRTGDGSASSAGRASTSNPPSGRPSHAGSPAIGAVQAPTPPGSSSPSRDRSRAPSPAPPAPPEEAHAGDTVQRGSTAKESAAAAQADKGWWTFTLPGKYLDRVHGYIHPDEVNGGDKGKAKRSRDGHDGDDEADDRLSLASNRSRLSRLSRFSRSRNRGEEPDLEKQNYHRKMRNTMRLRLAPPNVFSINQTTTPGWSTPWTPFRREEDPRDYQDPFDLSQNATQQSKRSRFEMFILQHPFSPLLIRTINLILIGCTLGLAAHIRVLEVENNIIGIMGTSTLFAIIVAPFAIVHIFVTLYIEYFGLPIGLWKIHTKMTHTLTELVFICLYSAVLSLAFNDLFTSSLECTNYTPYERYNTPPPSLDENGVSRGLSRTICRQQIAQVSFIFCSVVFYIAVLVISLLRIFNKVSQIAPASTPRVDVAPLHSTLHREEPATATQSPPRRLSRPADECAPRLVDAFELPVDPDFEDDEDDGTSMLRLGYALVAGSTLSLFVGLWSMLIGPLCAPTGVTVLDALVRDTYYKYLVVLLVPVTTCYVIINWWGLKIFRHA